MEYFELLSKEMKDTLKKAGYISPTPIQEKTLKYMLEKQDVIGQAQTGTGKTAAFAVPVLENLYLQMKKVQVLVMCPTRELAMQTTKVIKELSSHIRTLNTVAVYGGQNINIQIRELRRGAQIVVGTPGRLKDLINRNVLKLKNIRTVVLDEADEMLNIGFREDMKEILSVCPQSRQTVLFSATMPKEIVLIAQNYLKEPKHIKIGEQRAPVKTINQSQMQTKEFQKTSAVSGLLKNYSPRLTIVFCNTKRRVKDVQKELYTKGFASAALHGDMRQKERDTIMNTFRKGKTKILVATDVAARGIDVNNIDLVINYDIPQKADFYVHRIGRTGRAGKEGKACTLVAPKEKYKMRDIEKLLNIKIANDTYTLAREIV